MPANDPWLWTVDDLVAEVCHSNALFIAAGCSVPHTPDFTRLEEQIRSRGVTGEAFLTALNHNAIVKRNELNIPRLRQREALMSVVESLRLRSYIYKQHTATTGVDLLEITSADNSPSARSTGISNDVAVADESGRKRRKITHLSTAPLQNTHPDSHSQQTTNTAAIGPSHPAPSNTDEYAHLLRWQNVVGGEHIIDLLDEDELQEGENYGLGNVAEEDSRSLEDDDDDVVEEPSKRTKLSQDEIVDIINERIAFYTNTWKPNKGVTRGEEVGYDPVTMWNEAEVEGEREVLAQKYETDRIYYRSRLDGLCDQIVNFPGSNAEQIRRQCSNLEVTIDSMEFATWLRDIYKLEPVDDSDEEQVPDDQDIAVARDQLNLRRTTSALQVESGNEIIDLGSPPESSDIDDGNALPVGSNNSAQADPVEVLTRSSTRDSVIADSVEPTVYAHPSLLEPDCGLTARKPINHGDEPENASIATVRRWKWQDLVEHLDRKRVVSKVIHEMKYNDREVIRNRIRLVGKTNLIKEIRACIGMLCRRETKLQGVLPRDMPKILTFTKLFLSWWFCSNYSREPDASRKDLEELKICMDSGAAETSTFYDYVYTIMGTTFSEKALQHPDQPSQAEIIEISDDD
ncbi:hypothetical protein BKA58DRAFT_206926 [Alternaria rosae]|uniref:uncharacterized protein n=1 Tax=Alternaria rosae TaxID=1187941 RepID=UPI001E8CAAB5|nr:uncharacterized protein BKA58DRAFT_206926 [Alternaria rosae]KAH6866543.1 hypothetical protein BKA58DRAFT_206926 [Alternaria rosae]